MTHTPGPWEIDENHVHAKDIHRIALCDKAYYVRAPGQPLVDYGQTESNARLIAAAPELLEALEGLEGLYDEVIAICNDGTLDGSFVETRRSIIATRRAIAKAKGE